MRLMLIVGARPQIIKSAPIVREARKHGEIEPPQETRQGRHPEEDQNIRRHYVWRSLPTRARIRGRNVEEKVISYKQQVHGYCRH